MYTQISSHIHGIKYFNLNKIFKVKCVAIPRCFCEHLPVLGVSQDSTTALALNALCVHITLCTRHAEPTNTLHPSPVSDPRLLSITNYSAFLLYIQFSILVET